MLYIQDHTRYFWNDTMIGNGWKCILNCVSWIISIILNFNAICDAHAVQRQSYRILLKNNRIICLILRIILGNYFLTVSSEVENHLWLYFVYFLNHLAIYEEIHG